MWNDLISEHIKKINISWISAWNSYCMPNRIYYQYKQYLLDTLVGFSTENKENKSCLTQVKHKDIIHQ